MKYWCESPFAATSRLASASTRTFRTSRTGELLEIDRAILVPIRRPRLGFGEPCCSPPSPPATASTAATGSSEAWACRQACYSVSAPFVPLFALPLLNWNARALFGSAHGERRILCNACKHMHIFITQRDIVVI
eukprot:3711566-Pyramimonas_sp.AAC.1